MKSNLDLPDMHCTILEEAPNSALESNSCDRQITLIPKTDRTAPKFWYQIIFKYLLKAVILLGLWYCWKRNPAVSYKNKHKGHWHNIKQEQLEHFTLTALEYPEIPYFLLISWWHWHSCWQSWSFLPSRNLETWEREEWNPKETCWNCV